MLLCGGKPQCDGRAKYNEDPFSKDPFFQLLPFGKDPLFLPFSKDPLFLPFREDPFLSFPRFHRQTQGEPLRQFKAQREDARREDALQQDAQRTCPFRRLASSGINK